MLTEQFLASNFYPVPFFSSFGQLRVNVQIPFNQSASFIVLSAYDGNLINCLNSIFHQFVMTGATLLPRDTIILLKIIGERHSFESLRPICFKISCSAIKHLNKKMNTLINHLVLESRTPSSRDTWKLPDPKLGRRSTRSRSRPSSWRPLSCCGRERPWAWAGWWRRKRPGAGPCAGLRLCETCCSRSSCGERGCCWTVCRCVEFLDASKEKIYIVQTVSNSRF